MKRLRLALLLALVPILALSGCTSRFHWRQKMTVVVETPTGEVTGSAVTEVYWSDENRMFKDGLGWTYSASGEAVVVEVRPGRYLFALLKGPDGQGYMSWVAAAAIAGREGRVIDRELFAALERGDGRAAGVITVPDYQYPLMVTFDDINDPKTVHQVDPADLAASFGPDVRLKAVTLEVTGEPVTEGKVDGVLGWLDDIWPNTLDGKAIHTTKTNYPFANSLEVGHFSTENRK